MKFLLDAHLPPSLKKVFLDRGFDTIHTLDLPLQNDTDDSTINRIVTEQERILITKDDDFYDTFIIKQIPVKLVLVKTGNISKNDLKELFEVNLDRIITLLDDNDLLILTKKTLFGYNQ
ncbi:putative nuclease of predicted toxin-antitoxin system [Arcicella aurantiaca]|uniref:Putative nuclease of predicted toxin-antitoxin system n=1 Tax=Arcicella aurantiaca TaxID=591202 RepID=A0A316EAZ0_9BACT|nr:DUF5615 family PIN-like protein [Arcicella aurantiaca]PWK27297.1 putative nuclease of predicted toxin-antitoxin system [Arcicella aurantiaca]